MLTDERRARMDASLTQHGEHLVRSYDTFHKLSNWGILQDNGLYLLGLYLGRQDWCALAARRMDENLHRSVFADGSQWEQSPLYHCEVLHSALNTLHYAQAAGQTLPDRMVENIRRMCAALAKWCKPNGELLLQSDSDTVDTRDLLVLGAALLDDADLYACGGGQFWEENLWDLGIETEALWAAARQESSRLPPLLCPTAETICYAVRTKALYICTAAASVPATAMPTFCILTRALPVRMC